jgi:L-xylulokinase
MPLLLGIDSGLTVTKAVVFEPDGRPLAVARRRVPQLMPRPRHVERSPQALWQATAEAIREAIAASGRPATEIAAAAITAHGDGLYLVDREDRPLGNGILSLDSRAGSVVDQWAGDGRSAEALELTGQEPHAAAPSALLAWMRQEEPERFEAIGSILACKDWLRLCLTGTVGTDRTEASTSFTDVRTQAYATKALALYGLEDLSHALPPVATSTEVVGAVSRQAAAQTGLAEGTPVACGLHDVTASALGIGGIAPGQLSVVVGTYSINEIVSTKPEIDRRWFCRNAVLPGEWMNMAISPASTANFEWFLDTFCPLEQAKAKELGTPVFDLLADELDEAFAKPSDILFHPFLFGSPFGSAASAGFFGLHGWHKRGDMMKAVLEGVVFNHRTHVEALKERFSITEARLAGGGTRSERLSQMFADALGVPVLVTSADEAGALGAAICAGVAASIYPDIGSAVAQVTRVLRRHEPDLLRMAVLDERFTLYTALIEALAPHWRKIQRAGRQA